MRQEVYSRDEVNMFDATFNAAICPIYFISFIYLVIAT